MKITIVENQASLHPQFDVFVNDKLEGPVHWNGEIWLYQKEGGSDYASAWSLWEAVGYLVAASTNRRFPVNS